MLYISYQVTRENLLYIYISFQSDLYIFFSNSHLIFSAVEFFKSKISSNPFNLLLTLVVTV